MVRPELGTKRLCPNCGAKYYDLNHDPIMCPKCNASFATGIVAARAEPDDDEVDADDEGVELVALEDADETATAASDDDSEDVDPAAEEITVDADEDALIEDDDEEVSGVVRAADDEDEET